MRLRSMTCVIVLLGLGSAILVTQQSMPDKLSAPPPTGALVTMDCGPNNERFPECGLGGLWTNSNRDNSGNPIFMRPVAVPGSVTGRGMVEWQSIPSQTPGQYYAGHGLRFAQPDGSTRYARFTLRIGSGYNPTGNGDVWTDKFMEWGNGTQSRIICQIGPKRGMSDAQLWCSRGIDWLPNSTNYVSLTIGQVERVQIEVRGGTNGRVCIWKNNGNYATPTSCSGAMTFSTAEWHTAGIGFYHNATVRGRVDLAYGDVMIADTFDPAWR
jgi:hypothetical protein